MTFTSIETYVTVTCCHAGCGITWGHPATFDRKRREDHKAFYCPNGHEQYFSCESEAEKLRRELSFVVNSRDSAWSAERRARRQLYAARGVLTRTKNRIAAGVCPCCQRTFSNLARHMAQLHPHYRKADD